MAEKDSYWFRHDSTAGRGLKMRKMAHIYSHWGKGVYWDVVEILRDQNEYKFESDESSLQLLCDLVGCKDLPKFLNWFKDCLKVGLFEENKGFFICPPLCKNMVKWESSKGNGSLGGRPPKQPKKNPTNNPTNNPNETIIGEDSTLQNRTEQNNRGYDIILSNPSQDFEVFLMQNKPQIKDFSLLVESFNDKMDIELDQGKIEFTDNQLKSRFKMYARSWIKNQVTDPKPQNKFNAHSGNPIA